MSPSSHFPFGVSVGASGDAGIGAGLLDIQSAFLHLTSAQIKALKATPLTVIPAPGAGRQIVVLGVLLHLTRPSATYDTGTAQMFLGDPADSNAVTAAFTTTVTAGASSTTYLDAVASLGPIADAKFQNLAVVIANKAAGEFATGDGTLDITALYIVI